MTLHSRRSILGGMAIAISLALLILAVETLFNGSESFLRSPLSLSPTKQDTWPKINPSHLPTEAQLPSPHTEQPGPPEGQTGQRPKEQSGATSQDQPNKPPIPETKPKPEEKPKELPEIEDLLKREKEIKQKEARLRAREAQLDLRDQILSREEALVSSKSRPPRKKSLISYVYVESPTNRRNLKFFIQHALFQSADFLFTFNGETDAYEMLPNHPKSPWYDPNANNIEVIFRENKCLDFGAHGEALLREWDSAGNLKPMGKEAQGGKTVWEGYSRFILINASIRGPFMPYWSKDCWAEVFWNLVTEKVKLVGLSYSCHGDMGHVQSMLWATDRIGMGLLMQHPPAGVGYWCPIDMVDAIYGETRTTPTIHAAGYEVDALDAVYHSHDGDDLNADGRPDHRPDGYLKGCKDDDFFHENAYYGFNIHPYETIFMKSARKMQEILLGNLTEWTDGSGYSSYDYCDAGGVELFSNDN